MGAISEFPQSAGAASAVFGFVQTASAASTGFVVGQLYDHSLRPTAFTMLASVGVAALGFLLLRAASAAGRAA
jgi:DHA1 family bicyclomycin/chloramphenicol resistance-like MFS transporter